jgi:hypothetical protein
MSKSLVEHFKVVVFFGIKNIYPFDTCSHNIIQKFVVFSHLW